GWILSQRAPAPLSFLGPLVVPLAWVFLRHAHGIEIEFVVMTLREPEDCLVPPTEAATRVNAVSEGPDDSVSKEQALLRRKDRIDESVEGDRNSASDVMADLPAEAATVLQRADQQGRQSLVIGDEVFDAERTVIFLAHAVRWRGDDQIDGGRR